jgi:shikimate kinase
MNPHKKWKCLNCGYTDQISLYNNALKKPNFKIAPILPTCKKCKHEVLFTPDPKQRFNKRVFVLTGALGSGKTSTAEMLFTTHNFNAIDHDCIIDLLKHKYPNQKLEFNSPEAVQEIENNVDILLSFGKDIVLSLVIFPDELDIYRTMFQKRNLNYKIFYLCPDYATLLQRTKTRTCFGSITPEKWVLEFYQKMKPYEDISSDDFLKVDNSSMSLESSVGHMIRLFQ